MDHIFVFAAVIFVLNGNMRYVEFVKQDFMNCILDLISLADPDIGLQVNMTFKMNFLVI